MDWCREKADRDLGDLRGVQVQGLVAGSEYERTLAKSDALLIAYNFDPASTGYIGYSLANKMPECLASGAPLLAYGPRGVATIDYLRSEEHTSELQSLMRISYAVFCLKKKYTALP